MDLFIWETTFSAVCCITGELKRYQGNYIKANNIQDVIKYIRQREMDYLIPTGKKFDTLEEAKESEASAVIKKPEEVTKDIVDIISKMDYDQFNDWLETAKGKKQLVHAKNKLKKIPELKEYVKIIKAFIKHKYN